MLIGISFKVRTMRLGEFLRKCNSSRATVHRSPTRALILASRVMLSSLAIASKFTRLANTLSCSPQRAVPSP